MIANAHIQPARFERFNRLVHIGCQLCLCSIVIDVARAIDMADTSARPVLYWYDPMKPDARFDKPGRSPFMDMDLVPRYADEAGAGGVQINPQLTQSLGMRLATVTRESVATGIEVVGTLGFNERDVAIVQTRSAGFVEKVYARAPGDVVAAGAPLVDNKQWASCAPCFCDNCSNRSQIAREGRCCCKLPCMTVSSNAARTPAVSNRGCEWPKP